MSKNRHALSRRWPGPFFQLAAATLRCPKVSRRYYDTIAEWQIDFVSTSRTLLLALPDICGGIEYSTLPFGDRYSKWCDAYGVGRITNIEGIDIWLIRCSFLHFGNSEIRSLRDARKSSLGSIYLTESIIVSTQGVRKTAMTPGQMRRYALPVGDLCDAISRGTDAWLQTISANAAKQDELNRLLEIFPQSFSPP